MMMLHTVLSLRLSIYFRIAGILFLANQQIVTLFYSKSSIHNLLCVLRTAYGTQ
jgi:hypothetical protein